MLRGPSGVWFTHCVYSQSTSLICPLCNAVIMVWMDGRIAGVLFFIAGTQFVLGLIVAEASYPGYSISDNYISDLGVGPSSLTFNISVFLFGFLTLVATYFLQRAIQYRLLIVMIILMAFGAMGVGIFTSEVSTIHGVVSLMAFGFGGLSAIVSFKISEMPFSAISVALGLMTLGALSLFAVGLVTTDSLTSNAPPPTSEFFLGIGPGGMERMILYPAVIWLILFSGRLITLSETKGNLSIGLHSA